MSNTTLQPAPEFDAATAEDLAKTMNRLDRKDLARDQNVKRANGPSAVEVANIAKTIYISMDADLVTAKCQATEEAIALIAEAERQLNEQRANMVERVDIAGTRHLLTQEQAEEFDRIVNE